MHKISVCVPTYNRPDTLRQLINSFLRQDYKNKELIISDDTPNDSIKQLVVGYKNKNIKYFHNKTSLRFAKNYEASMVRSTGDYIVTLGDDDVLLNPEVLSNYVKIFKANPKVAFVCSNLVQFSEDMNIEYIINYVPKDTYFNKGEDAMKKIWMKSLFIGGLALRNNKNILKYFPAAKTLYPQVEFIGHVVNNYDAYGLAQNNIGFRSHDDQIIFRALKDKKIRQAGEHTTVEFSAIFNRLKRKYKLNLSEDFVAEELMNLQIVMMFKEKKHLGTVQMEENYRKFSELFPSVKNSRKFKIGFMVAKITPSFLIIQGRKMTFNMFKTLNSQKYKEFRTQLHAIIKDVSK